jgi:Zn-dependent protease with chaperone function
MDDICSITAPDALGEWLHTQLLQTYGMSQDAPAQERLRWVQAKLQRTRLPAAQFQAILLRCDAIMAFTAPGAYLYISEGLQQSLRTDDALAFVIAHEIAHHDLGHIAVYEKRLEMMGSLPGSSAMALLMTATERVIFSPERELAADAQGLKLCLSMGYDGVKCLETFDVLERAALNHQDRAMAYGPDPTRSTLTTALDQWIAKANTWIWQRTRGYPSIQERKERLQALNQTYLPPFQSPTEAALFAPGRKSPKMTLDQIDQALDAWRAKLLAAADNLLALDDNITYKRLEGKEGLPIIRLSGVTQKRVPPALEAMHDLFQYMGLLTNVVDRATELRKSVSRFRGAESTIRAIEELLYGPSIALPAAQTPLAQRSLLSASETANKITPERLLAAMMEAFETARDAVFAVETAWTRLETALGKRETELATLQRLAETVGEGTLPELVLARQQTEALHAQIATDPLGANANSLLPTWRWRGSCWRRWRRPIVSARRH